MKGFDFLRSMLRLRKPWVGWIMLLMMVNMVIPLFYLGTLEGKVVLGAFVFGALHQIWIWYLSRKLCPGGRRTTEIVVV